MLQTTQRDLLWLLPLCLFFWACPPPDDEPDGNEPDANTFEGFPEIPDTCNTPTVDVAELIIYPEGSSSIIVDAVNQAQSSVELVTYIFNDVGGVVDALFNAEDRGVDVRVMMEQTIDSNGEMSTTLLSGGVEVHWGSSRVNLTHQKSVLVDESVLYIMTHNITNAGLYQNREHILRITDPDAVNEALAVFNADWQSRDTTGTVEHLIFSPDNSRETLGDLLRFAEDSIDIQSHLMSDTTTQDLLKAKSAQGVPVRIILTDPDDMYSSTESAAAFANSDVEVHYQPSPYLHTKMVIADGMLYVGSINFTHNSIMRNRELGAFTTNTTIVNQAQSTFESDWSSSVEF